MLIPEARWLGRRIAAIPNGELFPLLNVGSQTRRFREVDQPWLMKHIFTPFARRQGEVVHLDLQEGEGIDVVGDLSDPAFRAQLAGRQFRSAICSNLLEHVVNRADVASWVESVVRPGGYLIVSCPYRFPYHPDPIDTMFRPTPQELAALFPACEIVEQAIVSCGTYATYLLTRELWTPGSLWRALRAKPSAGDSAQPSRTGRLAPWLFKRFKATCLILRKREE